MHINVLNSEWLHDIRVRFEKIIHTNSCTTSAWTKRIIHSVGTSQLTHSGLVRLETNKVMVF